MSDSISIPGVGNKYGTTELIQKLMEVERVPRERAQKELDQYVAEKNVWLELNQRLTKLRDAARSLYSYNNPFNERIAESDNERAVTAEAGREASFEKIKLDVKQTATADRYLSASIDKKYEVPAGTYRFTVGESAVEFKWKGGDIKSFSDALNRRGAGIVKSSLIGVSKNEYAFLIESLKTGASQRLGFEEAALDLALDIGVAEEVHTDVRNLGGALAGETKTVSIQINPAANGAEGLALEYSVTVSTRAEDEAQTAPTGPVIPSSGEINFKGVSITNMLSQAPLDAWEPPAVPARVDNMNTLYLQTSDGREIPLEPIADGMSGEKFSADLSPYGKVAAVLIKNTNTHRTIELSDVRVYDPSAPDGIRPLNPVDTASDAVVRYEGITMTRETNDIDDIIPGVTLHISEPTEKPVTIEIKPDKETIKESVISFVAQYNRIIADINILTQTNPQIINELEYFTDDERAAAQERLGTMQGEFSLNTIKSSLQAATSAAYQTGEDAQIQMLSQLGISTNAGTFSGVSSSKLRGYLEIDEKKLDAALNNDIDQIKALFGFDSDGDKIVDNGVAYVVDSKIQPYVQTAGILASKNSTLDSRIQSTQSKIERLDTQLAKKEQELRVKYGTMEGALNSLQKQSTTLDQQIQQNSTKR